MAFRIRPSEPFASEIRAVAERQLGRAVTLLEEQPDGPHKAVHDARKRFKRVRALYRLIEPDAKAFRKAENARIRDVAKSLSAARDATALIETTEYLAGDAKSPEEIAALTYASNALIERRDRIVANESDLEEKIAAAIEQSLAAIDAVQTLDLNDNPGKAAKCLGKAWRKQRKAAASALAACHAQPEADVFHELRKSGQIYWMHLSLLRDLWPSAMSAKHDDAKTLVEILGHEHDLSVLTQLINEQPQLFGNGDTMARLLGAVISKQQALRHQALEMADSVFADDREQESHIVALLWKAAATS
ncbi:CHAD domain-containing protein [Rhizobiales bacterium RZME27]|uniref:CHAD domain-containing protein n=1 Tax=Endobacterium cereale TaxID=2663029 RepID=A0A6A8ABW7_9HYPH|nr:CHAD domain-containing protein [Endobacterium cereale]MEB2845579.1 CHAD domain-containing protein [Endobacterium cereale]MQY48793.1 CHAD domain-containing protein [Endobacterium cereale]